jgi:hypothetical protein
MQLTAKLIQLLPIQAGIGKNGEWKKQDIIVETKSDHPKKYVFQFGEIRSIEVSLKMANELKMDFDIESRD